MHKIGSVFHGMRIISDDADVKDHLVVELTSGGDSVLRYYDEYGEPNIIREIDVIPFYSKGKHIITESDCTAYIKRQAGTKAIWISESIVNLILNTLS